ncbi:MAG: T9SS type A sorting domain-containing protein [Flavobacteriales bacterium]|nr:T9SS type A sorting domain-containing protein [Flavobacteriales bacterium]
MKKIFLASLILCSVNVIHAQITITSADMPNTNDTIRFSETNDIQGLDPVLTGTNYTWNFNTLVPASQRIDTFVSVTSTPLAYQFFFNNIISYPNHKASYALRGQDIGIPSVSITEVYNYMKESSTALDHVGFGSKINSIPSSTQNNPVDREYVFPMNYNDNHMSSSEWGVSVPGFGHYGEYMDRIDTVDGWGSVTTPFGTFNCLRVKSVLHKVDTTYIDALFLGTTIPRPEEIEYKWLAAGMGKPVLKIVTTAGLVSSIEYQDMARVGVSVQEYVSVEGVSIYPNPVSDLLQLTFSTKESGNLTYRFIDLQGKELAVINHGEIQAGNQKIEIYPKKYIQSPGVYLLELNFNNEMPITKKVFITN